VLRKDPAGPVDVPVRGDVGRVHDPAIARDATGYYVFFTGGGIHVIRSTDLVTWHTAPDVFAAEPAWVRAALPESRVKDLWAPDVSYWGGQWHLYYTASTWNDRPTRNSAIGHATSPTLDPAAPGYGWTDHGPVVQSRGAFDLGVGTDGYNAIDPNVAVDRDGQPWLFWGSAFDGIFVQRLNADGSVDASTEPVNVARRGVSFSVVEAAYVVFHDGFWWLFASYDYCCQGIKSNYRIVVGRSANITGPYTDRSGQSMVSPRDGRPLAEDAGTPVLAGFGTTYGPGHESVLHEGDDWFLVHHWYNAATEWKPGLAGGAELGIRPLDWDDQGWPIARGWTPSIPPPTAP